MEGSQRLTRGEPKRCTRRRVLLRALPHALRHALRRTLSRTQRRTQPCAKAANGRATLSRNRLLKRVGSTSLEGRKSWSLGDWLGIAPCSRLLLKLLRLRLILLTR